MKSRRGRPPKPAGEARRIAFTIRLTNIEKGAIVKAAKKAKKSVSDWSRDILLRAAKDGGGRRE